MVMATAGSPDNKAILITVANDTRTQRKAASGGGGSNDGTTESSDDKKQDKRDNDNKKSLMKLIGIELSLGAMLKQSQIFTGFLGSTFQLIGAFVDVLFAPLAPFLFKMVEVIAKFIPVIGRWSKEAVEWLKDAVYDLSRIYERLSGTPITPEEFVSKGFKFISLNGFAIMLGQKFAASMKPGFNWADTFSDMFKESDLVKHIGDFLKGDPTKKNIQDAFKGIFKALMKSWAGKFIKALKTFIKRAGIVGMVIGTIASMWDIVAALQEGKVGEAIVEASWFIISVGVPVAVGLLFGGAWVLLASLIVSAAWLAYEFFIPQEWRDAVNEFFEDLYYQMKLSLEGVFGKDVGFWARVGGFVTWMVETVKWATGFKFLEYTLSKMGGDMIHQINEIARSIADWIINGLIDMFNHIVDWLVPRSVQGKFGNLDRIQRQSMDDWSLLGGVPGYTEYTFEEMDNPPFLIPHANATTEQ